MEESGGVDVDDETHDLASSSPRGGGGEDGRCCECCWTYEGEGGRHAVFSVKERVPSAVTQEQPVVSASGKSSSLRPFVLRVRKSDLVEIADASSYLDEEIDEGDALRGGDHRCEGLGGERICCFCGHLGPNELKLRGTNREPASDAEEGGSSNNNDIKVEDLEILRLHRFLDAILLADDEEDDEDNSNNHDGRDSVADTGSSAAVSSSPSGLAGPAAAPTESRTGRHHRHHRRQRGGGCGAVSGGGGEAVSGAYVDTPQAVRLTPDLARTLRRIALASGRIPASRIKDWHNQKEDRAKEEDRAEKEDRAVTRRLRDDECWVSSAPPAPPPSCYGLRIPDYRVLPLLSNRRPLSSSHLSASLEIKPKAGYRAFSPLVHPERRIKYQVSRFVLLQRLWSQRYIEKNWAAVTVSDRGSSSFGGAITSRYDPLDLFSSDPSRILAAIRALTYETPQNNAKLTIDGQFVALGGQNRSSRPPSTEWARQVHRTLHLPEDSQLFAQLCAEVLRVEPLLSQILRLQLLDVLDGDGALLVYRHLVEQHCGGSRTKAEHLVDALEENESDDSTHGDPPPHALLAASPFVAPSDTSRIAALCEIVERTRQYLEAPRVSPNDARGSEQLDALHREAVGLVGELTKDECVYLLRNWLLSLTMCDVSFFLTLMCDDKGEDDDDECITNEALSADSDVASLPRIAVVRRQAKKAPGLVSVEWSTADCDGDGDGGSRGSPVQVLLLRRRHRQILRYQIKVIDCEPKPAKKLRDREAKEAPFSLLQD